MWIVVRRGGASFESGNASRGGLGEVKLCIVKIVIASGRRQISS